jgi:GH25 family lysozyme M1 (1,4-beta-N-acetylmuramidase)
MPPLTLVFTLRRLLAVTLAAAVALTTFVVAGNAPAADAAVAKDSGRFARPVIDGPDVASYQHPYGKRIRWHKVAGDGHEFAIVKATEGHFYRNPWFGRDYRGAREAGLVRGAYHFARPAYPVVRTARAQARYFADALGSSPQTSRTLAPALDLESTGGLSRGALVIWAQEFLLATRRLTGRTPMIYTYPYFWSGSLGDPAALARFPLWMASYSGPVDPTATLWQYTAGATVSGISGHVDMSRLMVDKEVWPELSDAESEPAWVQSEPGPAQRVHADPAAGRATVAWMPGDPGSAPIEHYRVTAMPGGATRVVPATQLSVVIDGLDNGTPYTFTVTPLNRVGAGLTPKVTNPVTPRVPTALTPAGYPSTTYGDNAKVRLRFTRPDTGAPLAGREIRIEKRVAGEGVWEPWRTVTTGPRGWTGVKLHQPAHNVDLRYTFDAPESMRPAQKVVSVAVSNDVTARLSKGRVHSGHRVVLRGHTTPGAAGVTVRRQAYYGHAWHVVQQARTDASGRYAFAFRPHARHRVVKHMRVVVEAFDHRSRGASGTKSLVVRR